MGVEFESQKVDGRSKGSAKSGWSGLAKGTTKDTDRATDDCATEGPPQPDARARAYRAAAQAHRQHLRRTAPERERALDAVTKADVIVVRGCYDHVEQVLEALEVAHTLIDDGDLGRVRLRPEQLLIINCPGDISRRAVTKVAKFVADGGSLFTTDWALRNVVEPAFPGLLRYNERPTADDVVRIEIHDHDNPYLKGVMEEGDDPLWWLEGSSYPIAVLDPQRVEVLIASRELGEKYGEEPVAVRFAWGEGEVFHMISHYYLQRTELRTARQQESSGVWFAEKGFDAGAMPVECDDLNLSEVESAYSSTSFVSNVITEKALRRTTPRE